MSDQAATIRAKQIFADAIGVDTGSRAKFVENACRGDAELRNEVDQWLSSYAESEGFIETPLIDRSEITRAAVENGRRFGNYTILREIGRGGMGSVFLAERSDGEFDQKVAVKIIRQTFAAPHLIERFRRERQFLASLNHPNIAHLLDGGVSEIGEPFVVMEYIDGISLIEFADRNRLNVRERLRLFQKICSAVAHSHRNLIIHRDLKPGNIIVDNAGEPKLLDFGVAKLLGGHDSEIDDTETVFRALTPAYASPEQLNGSTVTTSSDIYSLGIILYELLTGCRPFDVEGKDLAEIIRTATETEPIRPSARDHKASSGLRGDLDNIVLCSLRKEPARRYESADAFSGDIERYLADLPVNARPSTLHYRASKFFSRHRAGSIAALVIVISLIAAAFVSVRQARIASRERDIAQQERVRAEQISSFLRTILSAASPEGRGLDAKVIEVLDDTASRIDSEFATEPVLKAQVLATVGETYSNLGLPEKAERFLREALAIDLSEFGGHNLTTASTMIQLGNCLNNLGKVDEAAEMLKNGVSSVRELSPGSSLLAYGLFVLGENYVRTGRLAEAEALVSESVSIFDGLYGENNPESAYSRITLGRTLVRKGDLDGAEAMYRRSIDIYRSLPAKYEYRKALALFNLGDVLIQRSKFDEAIAVLNEGFPVFAKMGDSWEQFTGLAYFARAHFQRRDYDATLDYSKRAIALGERIKLEKTVDYLVTLNYLGLSLTRTGKPSEAEPYLRKFYEISFRDHPDGDIQRAYAEGSLGECLSALGRRPEAEPLLTRSYDTIRRIRGDSDAVTAIAAGRLADVKKVRP